MKLLYWVARLLMAYATAPLLGLAFGLGVSLGRAGQASDPYLGLACVLGLGVLLLAWWAWVRAARRLLRC